MLAVREEAKFAAAKRAGDWSRVQRLSSESHPVYGHFAAKEETVKDKVFLSIDVLPTFL